MAVIVYSAKEKKIIMELREPNVTKYSPIFNSGGNRIAYLEKAEEKHYLVIHNLTENISKYYMKKSGRPKMRDNLLSNPFNLINFIRVPSERDILL